MSGSDLRSALLQKKSPSGIRTAKTDVALVEQRLKAAQADYEVRYGKASK
jgi:hypothetical protein